MKMAREGLLGSQFEKTFLNSLHYFVLFYKHGGIESADLALLLYSFKTDNHLADFFLWCSRDEVESIKTVSEISIYLFRNNLFYIFGRI